MTKTANDVWSSEAKHWLHQRSQQQIYELSMAGLPTLISMTTVPTGSSCPHRVVMWEACVCVCDRAIHLIDTCQNPADLHPYKGFNEGIHNIANLCHGLLNTHRWLDDLFCFFVMWPVHLGSNNQVWLWSLSKKPTLYDALEMEVRVIISASRCLISVKTFQNIILCYSLTLINIW